MNVSAVLVTRGDVDLEPSLGPIRAAGIKDIIVWDNSKRDDVRVLGRYWAAREAEHQIVYTQDDDAMCPVEAILDAYQDDDLMVNVPKDEDWPWLAWGAIFKRAAAFKAFFQYPSSDADDIYRWPDVIFAELTPHRRVDLGHEDLPWAFSRTRMYRQPDHYTTQQAVRERCHSL